MKIDDLFANVFEDFQELQQEGSGIDGTRVWQIQWSITEDENENRPQYIFAQNKNEAMMKLSNRMNLFDSNIQIESVKEIEWDNVKELQEASDENKVVNIQQWKREKNLPVFDITYKDLIALFKYWNTGDEWGDTMGTLFAVADELYKRNEGPPDHWKYRPSPLLKTYDKEMSDEEKYNRAIMNQRSEVEDDDYMDFKHADSKTLEKFGEFLLKRSEELKAEGKDY